MKSSSKQVRILAGAVRALSADKQRNDAAAWQQSHERASKDIVVLPRMNVRGDVGGPGR